jgi:hypothetical protein
VSHLRNKAPPQTREPKTLTAKQRRYFLGSNSIQEVDARTGRTWSAATLVGNLWIQSTISQGRSRQVRHAPLLISPLCCRICRAGVHREPDVGAPLEPQAQRPEQVPAEEPAADGLLGRRLRARVFHGGLRERGRRGLPRPRQRELDSGSIAGTKMKSRGRRRGSAVGNRGKEQKIARGEEDW